MLYFGKELRLFYTGGIGSIGQMASNLLAVKVGVLKKKSAASAIPPKLCACAISQGSCWPGVKSFSKFDGR